MARKKENPDVCLNSDPTETMESGTPMRDSDTRGAILSEEETAFIRSTISLSGPSGGHSYRLDENDAGGDLSSKDLDALVIGQMLQQSNRYSLETSRGNFTYRFRPYLHRCTITHRFYIDLGYPAIIDQNGMSRELRVHPLDDEIELVELDQHLSCNRVMDISASGIRVRGTHRIDPKGVRLNNLQLKIENMGVFPLFGHVTRVLQLEDTDEFDYCIIFEKPSRRLAEALWEYVFRRFHTWSSSMVGLPAT